MLIESLAILMWNFDVICVLILNLFAEGNEGVKKICSKEPFHFVSIYNFCLCSSK